MHMDTEDDEFWQLLSSTVDEIIDDLTEEEFGDAFLDDLEEELEELGQDYQDIWAPEDPHCIPLPQAQPRPLPSLGGGASRSALDPVSVWSATRWPQGGYYNIRQKELYDLLLERWKADVLQGPLPTPFLSPVQTAMFSCCPTSLKKKWSSPQVGSLEDLRVASAGKLWRYYVGLCQKEGEEKEQKEGDEKEKGEEEQHPFNPAFRLTFN